VTVKVQSYKIPPKKSYGDSWHLEGQNESVLAVGIYCLQLEEGLPIGKMKFRPAKAEQFYGCDKDCVVEIKQGSAVVFSNKIPNRLRKIANKSSLEKRMTFLYFYIGDPKSPLTTTNEIPSTSTVTKALTSWANDIGKILPKPIIKHIMSYIPYVWFSLAEAKRFRKTVRDSLKADKSGWGYVG
jgi:hypothetical protein